MDNSGSCRWVSVYGKQGGKAAEIFGWLAVLACVIIGGFYVVLTGYSAAYAYFSAASQIPEDSKTFFTQTFLKTTDRLSHFGPSFDPHFYLYRRGDSPDLVCTGAPCEGRHRKDLLILYAYAGGHRRSFCHRGLLLARWYKGSPTT